LICGFVGARLFHVIYEEPQFYRQDPKQVFYVWNGGFIWYGGVLAALPSAAIWCWIRNQSFLFWADFFAPILAFGYGAGRVACFFNGCCYGKICSYPWAVRSRHPTQLYMMIYELIVMGVLIRLRRRDLTRGTIFFLWLGLHGCGRLWVEFFRDDFRGPPIFGFSISTLISLLLITIAIFGLTKNLLVVRNKR
jgi:phosphatidylglycerol:prolipoprotein diacylglycerol transferase